MRAQRLQRLRDDYRSRVATARSSALLGVLVDALFETSALTIPQAAKLLGVTHRARGSTSASSSRRACSSSSATAFGTSVFLAEGVLRAVEGLPEPHAVDAERDGPA